MIELHQSLLILSLLAALVPAVRGKIKQIPDICRPQIRPVLNHSHHVLMVDTLKLLAVITLRRMFRVKLNVGVRAVLRKSDRPFRIQAVILVQETVILIQLSEIPAKIQVVAAEVRDPDERAVLFQHKRMRHDRRSGRIHLKAELLQHPVILHQFLCDRTAGGDLVGQSPAVNGRVVRGLRDELPHLVQRILDALLHEFCDERNLRPHQNAVLVAEIIKCLRLLIMRKPQRVGANVPDDGHVLLHHRRGNRIADAKPVLMAGYSAQRIRPSIQKESFLRIDPETPDAESGTDRIEYTVLVSCLSLTDQHRLRRVQIRIRKAFPQTNRIEMEASPGMIVPDGSTNSLTGGASSMLAIFVIRSEDAQLHCLSVSHALRLHVNLNRSSPVRQIHLRNHVNPRRSIRNQGEVRLWHRDQIHIPVQAAIEGKIRFLRIHPVILRIIHTDGQQVVAAHRPERLCQPDAEGGEASLMAGQPGPVQKHLRRHRGPEAFKIEFFIFAILWRSQRPHVDGRSAVIIIAAVLPVCRVIRMRQADTLPSLRQLCRNLRGLCKFPVLIQRLTLTHT